MAQRYRHECPEGCKVFVGNLDRGMTHERLRTVFAVFGRIRDVWMATDPPGFGFIMYEHRADARSAVQHMNTQRIAGRVLTVELATGYRRNGQHKFSIDSRSDRRLARDVDQQNRWNRRSGCDDRSPRRSHARSRGSDDRYLYSSDYKRVDSQSVSQRRRRQGSECENSRRRTRSPDQNRRRVDGDDRSRRQLVSDR